MMLLEHGESEIPIDTVNDAEMSPLKMKKKSPSNGHMSFFSKLQEKYQKKLETLPEEPAQEANQDLSSILHDLELNLTGELH